MRMDIDKYKRLVVALRPSLLAVAGRIVGNTQDAEDVVQDVCLKIWHRRNSFEAHLNIEAYCTTMVKNLSIDKLRGKKTLSGEDTLAGKEADELLPDSLLEEKEVHETIYKIIAMLPPLQQRIIQLKDIEGYDSGEISAMTGITVEAVRNNLSRARKRIRETYLMYYHTKQTAT